MADDRTKTLQTFHPRLLWIDCPRCGRHGTMRRKTAACRYGENVTLAELARRVAREGGCALAQEAENRCSARVVEPPLEHWATLDDARLGGWTATLSCCRRLESMKRSKGCPEVFGLDVMTLVSLLGQDFKLFDLPGRCRCPMCQSRSIDIEWAVPDSPPEPGGTSACDPMRLRPTRAALGRARFRVVEG